MLVANTPLKVGTEVREPGMPVPEANGWPNHILAAHISQRKVVETDAEGAAAIRAKFLAGVQKHHDVHHGRALGKLEKSLADAKADLARLEGEYAAKNDVVTRIEAEIASHGPTAVALSKAPAKGLAASEVHVHPPVDELPPSADVPSRPATDDEPTMPHFSLPPPEAMAPEVTPAHGKHKRKGKH